MTTPVYKDATGNTFSYSDIDLGVNGRLPKKVSTDANGNPIFTSANPAVVSVPANTVVQVTQANALFSNTNPGVVNLPANTLVQVTQANALFSNTNPGVVSQQRAMVPTQTFVAVPAFSSGNTSDGVGGNATVVQVVPADTNRTFLQIVNNGSAYAELWYGSKPSDSSVNQTIKQGDVIPTDYGTRVFETRVPTCAIFASSSTAGGLSVVVG